MTNKQNLIWEEAILHVLGDHYPKAVSLRDIYSEVKEFRKLAEKDFEITKYNELRYRHVTRAILSKLIKEKTIKRVKRAVYVLVGGEEHVKEEEN